MKALIANDVVVGGGVRVCQVERELFEVALPLYWVDCPDDTDPALHCYNENTKSFELIPLPEVVLTDVDQIVY